MGKLKQNYMECIEVGSDTIAADQLDQLFDSPCEFCGEYDQCDNECPTMVGWD